MVIDPDIVKTPRLPHARILECIAVGIGGVIGTLLREVVYKLAPFDVFGTLTVNLLGAFLLGYITQFIFRDKLDSRMKLIKLCCTTGILGAFTTWGTFIGESSRFLMTGNIMQGAGYVLISICGGLLTALAGIKLAGKEHSC